ncbi:hypothetical protein GL58_02920 [Comamonas testosteroni]|uniref:Uncharacterized protein n=1 Tax=Comamonas testosteroni TaxID=285 RepID=A0A0L7MPW3_COMTE|nr:hypothetical protein [Comamonas testosteroni]KOC23937.1 hypothetical protein GL58_02920 [Comamonas testosteroni]KWT67784.1 hypothetical protein APV28_3589 [Comamonas testosteroni]
MRYAMHRAGETVIFQMMECPESLVAELTPPGVVCVPVGLDVTDVTHLIVDGVPVLKSEVDTPAS